MGKIEQLQIILELPKCDKIIKCMVNPNKNCLFQNKCLFYKDWFDKFMD